MCGVMPEGEQNERLQNQDTGPLLRYRKGTPASRVACRFTKSKKEGFDDRRERMMNGVCFCIVEDAKMRLDLDRGRDVLEKGCCRLLRHSGYSTRAAAQGRFRTSIHGEMIQERKAHREPAHGSARVERRSQIFPKIKEMCS